MMRSSSFFFFFVFFPRSDSAEGTIRERDLWDVIVNNDDITFSHVLPRLNSNDVKFLYGVNTRRES